MACNDCVNWLPDKDADGYRSGHNAPNGKCTLYPQWVSTHRTHFCGHQRNVASMFLSDTGDALEDRKRLAEAWRRDFNKAEDERKRLTKEIKAIRVAYRNTSGKPFRRTKASK